MSSHGRETMTKATRNVTKTSLSKIPTSLDILQVYVYLDIRECAKRIGLLPLLSCRYLGLARTVYIRCM